MATPSYSSGDRKPIHWTCSVCGADIADTTAHTAWHLAGVV